MSIAAAVVALSQAVVLDPDRNHGVWEGWGTSLCWMGNVFGERDDIADLLFTLDTVDVDGMSLPGLGMSIVRYNAGACSWNEIGGRKMQVSKIILPYRQMEGFWLGPDAGWDWSVDRRQRAMMQKAKERGANYFELFSNSPMWWMCLNDNPSGSNVATEDNLRPSMVKEFADYLATIARRAKDDWGIEFTTVEPFNEPVTDYWFADCKQEGSHMSIATQEKVLPKLREALDAQGLSRMKIAASDETSYTQALASWQGYSAETKKVVDQVNVHGYQGETGPRAELLEATRGKRLWNSEYGDGDGSGLSMARNLGMDMAQLHPTAWCYWQPMDGGGWGLLECDMPNAKVLRVNPKHYVLAQFMRHIRPGMKVLETGSPQLVGAIDGTRVVLVAIGRQEASRIQVDLTKLGVAGAKGAKTWLTAPKRSIHYAVQPETPITKGTLDLDLPADSIQTLEIPLAS